MGGDGFFGFNNCRKAYAHVWLGTSDRNTAAHTSTGTSRTSMSSSKDGSTSRSPLPKCRAPQITRARILRLPFFSVASSHYVDFFSTVSYLVGLAGLNGSKQTSRLVDWWRLDDLLGSWQRRSRTPCKLTHISLVGLAAQRTLQRHVNCIRLAGRLNQRM